MLKPQAQRLVEHGITAIVGVTLLLGPAWLYAAARRRHMIHAATLAAAFAWVAVTAVFVTQLPMNDHASLPAYLFLTGPFAIAVAPFAAAPLAIAWNRHR